MKNLLRIFITLFVFLAFSQSSFAKKTTLKAQKKSKRTTEAHFTGSTVNGKYMHSPEALVSVEKEKKMILVVKPRQRFNYQLNKSFEEYK